MDRFWTTSTLAAPAMGTSQSPRELSSSELDSLLGGRRFGSKQETELTGSIMPEYDASEVAELQEFCTKHGIIGVNFVGMRPNAALKMLKVKMGINEQSNKKTILHG